MPRGLSLLAAGALLTFIAADLQAHDVAPKPVAALIVTTEGEHLTVAAHLPVIALADVNLTRDADGHIVRTDLERPLQIVARELAATLELQQGDTLLPLPTQQAMLTPDESYVDVKLGYTIRAGAGSLSGRLRAFRAGGNPIPIVARFVVSPEITRTFEVSDGSERVTFDPDVTTALAYFGGRGARTLLDDWDVVLFAICLVVPVRALRSKRSATMALIAGEVFAATLSAGGWPAVPPALIPIVMTVATSVIVIASLQAVVNPASRWLAPLALLFGLANGFALGQAFVDTRSFAGDHPVVSFLALIAVVVFEQLWLIALLSAAVALLYRWGLPERVAVIGAAACVCHEALDAVVERSTLVAQATTRSVDHFLIWLTLGWAVIVLAAGLMSAARPGGPASPPLAHPAGARP